MGAYNYSQAYTLHALVNTFDVWQNSDVNVSLFLLFSILYIRYFFVLPLYNLCSVDFLEFHLLLL